MTTIVERPVKAKYAQTRIAIRAPGSLA